MDGRGEKEGPFGVATMPAPGLAALAAWTFRVTSFCDGPLNSLLIGGTFYDNGIVRL